MEELRKIIEDLEAKSNLLIQSNIELRAKTKTLTSEVERLKAIKAECELEIASLKLEKEALLVASSFSHSQRSGRAAKVAIDKILREIDDCIALVNK